MTTREEIGEWFDRGVRTSWDYMIIVCDTFDHSDYPAYSYSETVNGKVQQFNDESMSRVMEVYNLSMDRDAQLKEQRAFHLPKGI